jgi:hypothetical protein
MDTNEDKLLYKDEVFQIGECAIEVLNTLGYGIVENHMKTRSPWNFKYAEFRFGSNLFSTCCIKAAKSACLFLI